MSKNSSKPIRVLYAEDEEVLRDVVSEYLEAVGGYKVKCAVNGQEGVDMAESWKPDFILMDVRMPIYQANHKLVLPPFRMRQLPNLLGISTCQTRRR